MAAMVVPIITNGWPPISMWKGTSTCGKSQVVGVSECASWGRRHHTGASMRKAFYSRRRLRGLGLPLGEGERSDAMMEALHDVPGLYAR